MLGRVFGDDVLAALREGFLTGDLTGVVPLLTAATAKPHLRQAALLAFADVCAAGEADAVALLLEFDGVNGDAVVNPEYARNTENDENDDDGHTYGDEGNGYAYGDESNEEGDTILTRAVRRGQGGIVRALVESGKADVNRAGPNGGLPLVLAIHAGDATCVEALLSADGIDTNQTNIYGQTALIAAARVGSAVWVQRLLGAAGVAVNHEDPCIGTALRVAAAGGHAGCVRALLQVDGVEVNTTNAQGVNKRQMSPLIRTIHNWCALGMAERWARGEPREGDEGGGAAAAAAGRLEACARALASAKGIDLNCLHYDAGTGRTALHDVCSIKHAGLVEFLLVAGGCRFALTAPSQSWRNFINQRYGHPATDGGDTALALAAGDEAVAKVFASGVDYWQRRLHGGHGWAMKEVARTLLLIDQRLDANAALLAPHMQAVLPYLPKEVWLVALGFLRSADFMPQHTRR